MDNSLFYLVVLPIILIVAIFAIAILRAGGIREWAARWRENAEDQGGVPQVILRIVVMVLAITLISALIQWLLTR